MTVRTHHIRSIPSVPDDFPAFARGYAYGGVAEVAEKTLVDMKLDPEDARWLSHQIGEAFITHYRGDEVPRKPPIDLDSVNLRGRAIIAFRKKLVRGLYTDLPPGDNHLEVDLATGNFAPLP
jgi:hypothetical protein